MIMKLTHKFAVAGIIATLLAFPVQAEETMQPAALSTAKASVAAASHIQVKPQPEKTNDSAVKDNSDEIVDCFYLATSDHPICRNQ